MSVIRTRITGRVKEMLETITRVGGYRTQIGEHVHVGVSAGEAEQVPSIWLTPGTDRGTVEYGNALNESEYEILAAVNSRDTLIDGYVADPSAQWVIVDALIADVRQCMETPDATLNSLIERLRYESAEPAYREDGGELCGARIRYTIQYRIAKGDPDNLP